MTGSAGFGKLLTRWERRIGLGLTLLLAAVSLGCAGSTPPAKGPADSAHLVAGAIKLDTPLRDVFLYARGKAAVGRDVRVRRFVYPDGTFVLAGLPPGDYYIAGFADHAHTYWIEYDEGDWARALVRVGDGEIAFAGVHEVRNLDNRTFGAGFDFVRLRAASERTVLTRLADQAAPDTTWLPTVRRRLDTLR